MACLGRWPRGRICVSILIVLELPLWLRIFGYDSCSVTAFQSLLFWNYRCGLRPPLYSQPVLCFNPYCSGITAVARPIMMIINRYLKVSILIVLELPLWRLVDDQGGDISGVFQSLLFWNYRCGSIFNFSCFKYSNLHNLSKNKKHSFSCEKNKNKPI